MEQESSGFYYLASPYTHPDEEVRQERYEDAMEALVRLTSQGLTVFSPIIYCHEMAKRYGLPTDFQFWRKCNHTFIELSVGMIILKLDGWEKSSGIADEVDFCAEIGVPVTEMSAP